MKNLLVCGAVLAILSGMFTGCGKTQEPTTTVTQVDVPQVSSEFEGAPSWVLDPTSIEGVTIATIGTAPIGVAGLSLAKTEALADARNEMARSIDVKVNSMIKRFVQQTGVGDDATVEKVVTDVSKQLTGKFISGSVHKSTWVSKTNNIFVLVVLDQTMSAAIKEESKKQIATSYQNEKALWQQFQSKKAQDELEAELEKAFGTKE